MSIKKFKIGRRVKFGGFIADNVDGKVNIEVDPGKLERIRDFPTPQSKDDIASFVGLVITLNNWSGAISPKMEKIRELHTKGIHFDWTDEHDKEFKEVKEHLMETTRLATWDKNLPLKLYTDAAKHGGFGFCLTQPEGDREHIIFCGSTGLTDAQRRWSMTELEMGAVVYALQSAYNFTYGADEITIMTDHASLVGLPKECLDEIANPRLT